MMLRQFMRIFTIAGISLLVVLAGCTSNNEQSSQQKNDMTGQHSNKSANQKNSNNGRIADDNNQSSDQNPATNDSNDQKGNTGSDNHANKNDKQDQSQSPQHVKMQHVTALRLADTQIGWSGGKGWIAKTTNGGKKWVVQYQGKQTVHQLFALNHNDVWATFDEDKGGISGLSLLKTMDGGNHWSPVGSVPSDDFLHFISKKIGFSAHFETLDGGETWKKLSIPKNTIGHAYFHDLENGWVITKSNGQFNIERTTDGGKTWAIVMSRKTVAPLTNAIIRSADQNDAWIECIGDSGMTQTSYSLFHTTDGGAHWQTVIANSTAGGGPAPGFPLNYNNGPHNAGASPGTLYVVNPNVTYMSGKCNACDKPNSIGWTHDGGKTWVNGNVAFSGYGQDQLAFADSKNGWWIITDNEKPAVMYTTIDGGVHWKKVFTFQ